MSPLDGFHSLAMWGVLALALIVLAARVAWAVWRSLRDERDLPDHLLIHDAPQNVRLVERRCGCPDGCPCRRGPNDYCRCDLHGPWPYDWRAEVIIDGQVIR